jgi:hypothetical protein
MKYIPHDQIPEVEHELPVVELTRRNLNALLAKLDDPLSHRTLLDPDCQIAVRAVEDPEHYKTRASGVVFMPTDGLLYDP